MREIEYCINNFNKNFNSFKQRRIALYGTGTYAKKILSEFPEYHIVCLVDDTNAGKYIRDCYVVTFLQMLELDIDLLIIAAQISSSEIVYNRIALTCKINRICLYNMYGKDMFKIHGDYVKKKLLYPQLTKEDLQTAIIRSEVVSFDLCNTLFAIKYTKKEDFYKRIEEELKEKKLYLDNLIEKVDEYGKKDSFIILQNAINEIYRNNNWLEKEICEVQEIIYSIIKEILVPRKSIVEMVKFAFDKGKRVCFIEDWEEYRFSKQIYLDLLKQIGITSNYVFISGSEHRLRKCSGLYRVLKEEYGETAYLHIGDKDEADGIVPQFYDMDTFLIGNPYVLFEDRVDISRELLEIRDIRKLYERYIIEICADEFLVKNIDRKRICEKELLFQKKKKVQTNILDIRIASNGRNILVVDNHVPYYDRDAGGRCAFMYLKSFVNLGMKVFFMGNDFKNPEPYTSALEELGIIVLHGEEYACNWQEWLVNNAKYFDYFYLQRPNVSIKYIDLIRQCSRGKIFYFAHDLHHIRLYRQYQLTGESALLENSQNLKKLEMELFEKADICHVVGSYEQKLMQEKFPDKPIRNIPLYIYEDLPVDIEKNFAKRKDILFVGGFSHPPNVDAVLWFSQEIYPEILRRFPDIVWHVVGSNVPEKIERLSCSNIIIHGYLSDRELEDLYRSCRMAVVPLRYGAGIKGKVVEAAYYQLPLVTTPIGGEGLGQDTKAFVMTETPAQMSDLIIKLYQDYSELRQMSDSGKIFIESYFMPEAAQKILCRDLKM